MPDTSNMTDRQILEVMVDAVKASHTCLDSFREEQGKVNDAQAQFNEETREKRHAQANAVMSLGGQVADLSRDVRSLSGLAYAIGVRMGVNTDAEGNVTGTVKPAPGAWSLKKMALTLIPLLSGIVLLAQIGIPVIKAMAVALYHAVMTAST